MQVIRELTQSLKMDSLVTAAVVGPHLIAVAGRRLGLAANLHGSSDPRTAATIKEAENLLEKSACDIAPWLLQEELIKAGIGMAALNSVLEINHGRLYEMNAKQIISARATGKNLMVVGHFPFVESMRSMVGNLWVMEKQPGAGDISENEGYQLLSEADVVAITASSLINHTFERIMFHCRPASFKVMLGPSTPLSPVLFDYGLDVIGGVLVEDENAVLSMVEHGAAFRHLKGVRTVVMAKELLVV